MSQAHGRVPCTTCGYTSDPGSLFCALCGSALRRTPNDRGDAASAFTAIASPPPTAMAETSFTSGFPEFTGPPMVLGPDRLPVLSPVAKSVLTERDEAEPVRRSWHWAGLSAAARALALGLFSQALDPPRGSRPVR